MVYIVTVYIILTDFGVYIRKRISFCGEQIDPFKPSVNDIIQFLMTLYKQGLKYSVVQTARAAINNLTHICGDTDFSNKSLLKRFMMGIFASRPSLPRYSSVWDTNVVLSYLAELNEATLLQLSCKLSMLFLLLTAQRCQTLHLIELDDIEFLGNKVVIHPNRLLKQSKPRHHLEDIVLQKYVDNPAICIFLFLQEYIQRTSFLRGSVKKLLISTQKPHKAVSQQTVSRWVKTVMSKAGVNQSFGVHSTRAAASSAAKLAGVPLNTIIKTAGWKNAATFAKFYHKKMETEGSFQLSIQSNSN